MPSSNPEPEQENTTGALVAIIEIGPTNHYCAVQFKDRPTAEAWAAKHDAQILATAALVTQRDAIRYGQGT